MHARSGHTPACMQEPAGGGYPGVASKASRGVPPFKSTPCLSYSAHERSMQFSSAGPTGQCVAFAWKRRHTMFGKTLCMSRCQLSMRLEGYAQSEPLCNCKQLCTRGQNPGSWLPNQYPSQMLMALICLLHKRTQKKTIFAHSELISMRMARQLN